MTVTFDVLTSRALDWSLDDFVAEANRLLPEVVPIATTPSKLEVNARLVRHYTTEGVLPKPLKDGAQARYDTDHLVRLLTLRRLLAEGYPSAVAGAFLARHDRESLARFLLGEFKLDLSLAGGGPPSTASRLDHLAPAVRERLAAMRARAGLPPLHAAPSERAERASPLEGTPATVRSSAFHNETSAAPRDEVPFAAHDDLHDDAPIHDASIHGAAIHARQMRDAPADDEYGPPFRDGATFTRYELLDGLELHVRNDFEDPTTPAAWNTLRDALLARLERIAVERSHRR